MATSRATGAQIAFEVQYAGMTPAEWQARHDSYREMGIVDVWLWGYGGAHFHPRKDSSSSIMFGSTLFAVRHAGLPILFIDPAVEHIGYATRDGDPYGHFDFDTQVLSGRGGELQSEPLSAFWIDADRKFLTDRLVDLLATKVRIKEAREKKKREEEERERRRQEGYEAFYARVRTKSEALARRWPGTPEHRRILEIFGVVPDFLKHVPVSGKTTIQLPVPPVVWQGKFYLKYIHKRPDGWRVSIRGMTEDLDAMDRDVRFPEEAVRSWLAALEEHGHVARVESEYRHDRWPKYEVRARLTDHDSPAVSTTESLQTEAARAEFLARPGALLTAEELRARGLPVRARRPTSSGKPACTHCLAALESGEEKVLGYHRRCAPGLSRVLNHPLRA